MNPNAGEPDNQGGSVVEPPLNTDLSGLQSVVDVAREAAAVQTPQAQFENQFGSPQPPIPPVVDNAAGPGLMDATLSNLETLSPTAVNASTPQPSTDNLAPEQTKPVDALAPEPEQTPADKLKQEIADRVDAFLEKVIKEKVAV